jgi:pimeloyl-ACP methyl ester carboxylesterase
LATTYPHLVEKLVVVGTPPSVKATADSPGIEQEFWQRMVKLIEAEDYERAMPLFWAREFSEPGSLELVNTFARTSLAMPKEVFKVFFTVHDPCRDIRHLLPRVRVPTLVLHGEEDRIVPLEAGRWVASQIPGAEFFAFKGCGHLPAFSAPAQFASVLRHFLLTGRAP